MRHSSFNLHLAAIVILCSVIVAFHGHVYYFGLFKEAICARCIWTCPEDKNMVFVALCFSPVKLVIFRHYHYNTRGWTVGISCVQQLVFICVLAYACVGLLLIYTRGFFFFSDVCWSNSSSWTAKISRTISGRPCQAWKSDYPHEHTFHDDIMFPDGNESAASNFCRDPDGKGAPWCFTTDNDVPWQFCDAPPCAGTSVISLEYQT